MSPIKSVSLALFASLAVACGGSSNSDGSDPATSTAASASDYCAAFCARMNQCDSTRDVTSCGGTCTSDNAASMPKMRADVVQRVLACEKGADCPSLLSGSGETSCIDEAQAQTTPSGAAQAFCGAYADAASKCSATVDEGKCLDSAKIFTDGALGAAQACTQKACADVGPCVQSALGGS